MQQLAQMQKIDRQQGCLLSCQQGRLQQRCRELRWALHLAAAAVHQRQAEEAWGVGAGVLGRQGGWAELSWVCWHLQLGWWQRWWRGGGQRGETWVGGCHACLRAAVVQAP